MEISNELDALRENLLADTSIEYVSQLQIGGLNGLIRKGLQDKSREMRIAVLREWAGDAMWKIARQEINSAKNLTAPVASFLINLLLVPDSTPWRLSSYGKNLIEYTEKSIKERSLQKAF